MRCLWGRDSTKNPITRFYGMYNVELVFTFHKICMEIRVESKEIIVNN
jgi:two-component system, LytTR family, sensor histidine kinase AgrC